MAAHYLTFIEMLEILGGAIKIRCVSADVSWAPMKDEFLYVSHRPDMAAAGWTEKSNAPTEDYKKL
jgi:hypothetical protein